MLVLFIFLALHVFASEESSSPENSGPSEQSGPDVGQVQAEVIAQIRRNAEIREQAQRSLQAYNQMAEAAHAQQEAQAGPSQTTAGKLYATPQQFYSWTNMFEIFAYDKRCIPHDGETLERSVVLWSGPTQGFRECKIACTDSKLCAFFAYWFKRNRCELYEACFSFSDEEAITPSQLSPRKLKDVKVFRRLSECDSEIDHNRGRYIKKICAAFPDDIVRYKAPNQNLHCDCVTGRWAVCAIFVDEDSLQEHLISSILSPPRQPFAFNPLQTRDEASIMFGIPPVGTPLAEARVFSQMELLHKDRCLHITLCTDSHPVCPITGKPFLPGEPVMILKADVPKTKMRKPVPCISMSGMMHISMTLNPFTELVYFTSFKDPHGRFPAKVMDHKRDYDLFFIFDDFAYRNGLCMEGSGDLADISGLSLEEVEHSDEGSSEMSASPELGQPQQSRRKSRRGGKGKKKTGKSPLSSGYASSPPIAEEGEESQPRVDDSELKPFTDAGSSFAADAILTFAPSKTPSVGSPNSRRVSFQHPPGVIPERTSSPRKLPPPSRKVSASLIDHSFSFLHHNFWIILTFLIISFLTSLRRRNSQAVYIHFDDL